MSSSVLVIGIGNEYRQDDGVGIWAARQIEALHLPGVQVMEQSGEGAALMAAWENQQVVIVVDAVSSGAAPGAIYRFDAETRPIPACFFHYSTHVFSLAEAVELARVLRQLPPRLMIFGVEGKDFSYGMTLSAEIMPAAQEVVSQITQTLRLFLSGTIPSDAPAVSERSTIV